MARLETEPRTISNAELALYPSSRRHFATIAWLRWRIFVNSLRGKSAAGELAARILSYPILAIMVLGPSIGAGFAAFYLVNRGIVGYLAIPLWIIFVLWQFVGVSTSATGPSFDLSSLIRFPIRYRDYLLMRLSFGLMDPPTLAGICCLIAMSLGVAVADPGLCPWATLALAVYAACNILFSRMIYSWMERWLAQRRTRELLTVVILAVSVCFQFVAQFAQRLGDRGHHAPPSPFMRHTEQVLVAVNWFLPPGLTASSIDHFHSGMPLLAIVTFAGLLAYTVAFLLILHLRLHAEYMGENLSEAPAAVTKTTSASRKSTQGALKRATLASDSQTSFAFLPATVAACLIKEVRYLLRSGPKLYALVMPVFIVILFSVRTSGLNYAGMSHNSMGQMLFAYGCAYTQLIFVSLLYNSLGNDGAGVQFYFIAPLRMRDVMLAKNLLTVGIFAVEVVLIYIASAFLVKPAPLDLTAATLAWSAFALFLNMSIGNVRSIVSPKGVDPAKVRSQNVSGLNSLISLVTVAVTVALGALVAVLCTYMHAGYWLATAIFLVLATLSIITYVLVLRRLDDIAARNLETLTAELGKRQ